MRAPLVWHVGRNRIASLDIFRGLTVLVMVFVNDVSGVKGLPWWTYHMPEDANGMTYVDMVFPAFLFMVGMSIPLAINHRRSKGESYGRILAHVVMRSTSLVFMGLLLANLGNTDPQLTGISPQLWAVLAFVGIFLFWNRYPRSAKLRPFYAALKWTGLFLLAWLVFIFRRSTAQHSPATLDFSYPEILGLIGFAYFSVSLLYILLKKNLWTFAVCLAALNAMNAACRMGSLRWLENIPIYFWPFETGSSSSIAMAGLVAYFIFFDTTLAANFKAKARWALGYAVVLFGAGWALMPLGISKNHGTPTWCLYSAAAGVVIFLVLFWVADVKRSTTWAWFVYPAGSNTLTTYLLPWLFYSLPFAGRVFAFGPEGWLGVVRALIFTAFILALSAVATRLGIRLQL